MLLIEISCGNVYFHMISAMVLPNVYTTMTDAIYGDNNILVDN